MSIANPPASRLASARALLQAAVRKFLEDRAPQMGAALAYYTAFAIAPLLMVAVSVAGLVIGDEAAEGEVVAQLEGTVGTETTTFVEGLVESARGGSGAGGTVLGLAIGLVAASALAVNLRRMLNSIWGVPYAAQTGLVSFIRARVASFAVVAGSGLLLPAVLAASSALAAIGDLPGAGRPWVRFLFELANLVAGLALTAVAFAALLRYLPAARVAWRPALLGGVATSVLFTAGSWILARYLGSGAVGRGFGAAAALIVLLVFVYYSAQILLFGAEIAAVYGRAAEAESVPIEPARDRHDEPAPAGGLWPFLLGLAIGGWAKTRKR